MKSIFRLLFILSVLFVIIYGWTAIELTDDPEEHEGYCHSQNEDVGILKVGEETKFNDACIQVSCGADSAMKKGIVTYFGCGVVSVEPPCKVVKGNLSAPYPECCDFPEC